MGLLVGGKSRLDKDVGLQVRGRGVLVLVVVLDG